MVPRRLDTVSDFIIQKICGHRTIAGLKYIYFLNSCVSDISLNQLKRSKENNKSVHYTLLCLKYLIPCQAPYSKNFPRMSGINEFSEDSWTSVTGDFTYLCIHYHH